MLKQRIIWSIIGLIVLIALLSLNTYLSVNNIDTNSLPLLFIVLTMAGVSGYEVSKVVRNRFPNANKLNGIYAAMLIPFVIHTVRPFMSPYADQLVMMNFGTFVGTIGATVCILVLFLEIWNDIEKRGTTGLKENLIMLPCGLYVGAMTSFLLLLGTSPIYISALVYIFFIVFVFDVSCYFVGNAFKGKKLCPKISPNKTWSGTLGGIALATLASGAMYYVPNIHIFKALNTLIPHYAFWVMGFIIAIAAQCGDLLESAFKRWGEVKDSGRVIPGHGGMLDRFDSLFLAAPTFYFLLMVFMK